MLSAVSCSSETVAGPSSSQPPAKRRRITEKTSAPIYGPIPDDRPERNLGHILLNSENDGFRQKCKTIFKIALTSKSKISVRQADYSATHEDVRGRGQTIPRMNKITHLRNTVPEFLAYENVSFDYTRSYWVVYLSSLRSKLGRPADIPLFVGQCPVYIAEALGFMPFMTGSPYERFYDLDAHVDSRAIVDDENCQKIARAFPSSIGMRVLTFGLVEIFYPNNKAIQRDIRGVETWPTRIGNEYCYSLKVVEVEVTAPRKAFAHPGFGHPGLRGAVQPSVAVASDMSRLEPKGCVGLRIHRKADTHDCWTTVTHPWLVGTPLKMDRLEHSMRMLSANVTIAAKRVKDWLGKDKESISQAESRQQQQGVLGTNIYLAGEKTQIGTITHCYDNPRDLQVKLLWPLGIDHDLSLVTAPEGGALPPMTQIPNHARIGKTFVTPNEILNAESPQAFLAYYRFTTDARNWRAGHFVTGQARDAVIAGTEYWWERRHLKIKRAIIWRTMADDWCLKGGSGGVVCLGNPATEKCRAAMFQNYQSLSMKSNRFWEKDIRRRLTGLPERCSFKGGFILPEDVQNATIVFDEDVVQERRSVSGPSGPVCPEAPMVAGRRKENRTDE